MCFITNKTLIATKKIIVYDRFFVSSLTFITSHVKII